MKVEELAYKISDIKTIPLNTIWKRINFDNIMGYLKNDSSGPVRFAVTDPVFGFDTKPMWGIDNVSDTFLEIDPHEIVGPLFLGTCYMQVPAGTGEILVVINEVR